jgi:integrase
MKGGATMSQAITAAAAVPEHAALIRRAKLNDAALADVVAALIVTIGPALTETTRRRLATQLLRSKSRHHERRRPLSVGKLCQLFCRHAAEYYPQEPGQTCEASGIRNALRPLRKLFAHTYVSDFGPLRLKQVREDMIQRGWCRKTINQQVGRIKRMFTWGVENELVDPSVFHGIHAVAGLRVGRSSAPESAPVRPVPDEVVDAVLPFASPQVCAMIQLQRLTGMRPGEVCIMRTSDIDTHQQPWVYRPSRHKTQHHQHERAIFLGPKAQQVIQPFMNTRRADAYVFSPAAAEKARRRRLHKLRVYPDQLREPASYESQASP